MNMNTNIDGARAIAGLAIVLALPLSSGAATAQQQTYRDAMGRTVGRSVYGYPRSKASDDERGENSKASRLRGGARDGRRDRDRLQALP